MSSEGEFFQWKSFDRDDEESVCVKTSPCVVGTPQRSVQDAAGTFRGSESRSVCRKETPRAWTMQLAQLTLHGVVGAG